MSKVFKQMAVILGIIFGLTIVVKQGVVLDVLQELPFIGTISEVLDHFLSDGGFSIPQKYSLLHDIIKGIFLAVVGGIIRIAFGLTIGQFLFPGADDDTISGRLMRFSSYFLLDIIGLGTTAVFYEKLPIHVKIIAFIIGAIFNIIYHVFRGAGGYTILFFSAVMKTNFLFYFLIMFLVDAAKVFLLTTLVVGIVVFFSTGQLVEAFATIVIMLSGLFVLCNIQ